jgi:biotin operon repressor
VKYNKKCTIVLLLRMLETQSDISHPLSQSTLSKLMSEIGVPCDRKTVGRNIRYLTEFGYPIKRAGGKGYYLLTEALGRTKNKFAIYR